MSYSPSDRCPECGKFQDCRCPDPPCDWCGHDEGYHSEDGCLMGATGPDACACVGFNPF